MNERDAIRHFNDLFGFLKLEIGGEQVKIKFTLGSFMDLKEAGIDIFKGEEALKEAFSDITNLAKLIFYGLPREYQSKINIIDLAYKIEVSDFSDLANIVKTKFKDDNMITEKHQENSLDSASNTQENAKKKLD
jgi:hypothetical protein